ncbi:MAG: hypothetical protein JWQ57_687 [Mucilaginibacter sp.]|nr:hypothetical protein [Mucilaginibacter sp.]
MKYWFFCIFLSSSLLEAKGQAQLKIINTEPKRARDSIHITKVLPIIKPDPCLETLLEAIAKSNRKHYDPGGSFYGINFSNRGKYKYLEVFMGNRHDAKTTNYIAEIKLKNTLFLCNVDFNNEPLFHKTALGNTKIELNIAKKSIPDTWPVEPSLQGTLSVCKGLPIYIEVYTPEPIPGYKMEVRH